MVYERIVSVRVSVSRECSIAPQLSYIWEVQAVSNVSDDIWDRKQPTMIDSSRG
jgi:hypothetical protein